MVIQRQRVQTGKVYRISAMKKILLFVSLITGIVLFTATQSQAQEEGKKLTLEEVIQLALDRSPDALMAKHQLKGSYWQFKSYKASTLPHLSFEADLPSFNRSIGKVQQNDGSYAFRNIYNISAGGGLSLSQNIGLSGTQIYMSSSLDRSADFLDTAWNTQFLSNPLQLGVVQPIFKFNKFKWDRKIEPLRYDEAIQDFMQQREDIVIKAINVFFDLLAAQIDYQINLVNLANNDTIYRIAQGRFEIGTIPENELLQLELEMLRSQASVEGNKLNYDNMLFRFKSFLKLDPNSEFDLIEPKNVMTLEVEPERAIQLAWNNNSQALAFKRRELEAHMNVDQARKDNSIGFDLRMNYGLSRDAIELEGAYKNLQESQIVSLGVAIPILDWGRGRGQVQMAESNLELEKLRLEQDKIDFNQSIFLKVKEFNMQKYQLEIAEKSDLVAQKSYNIAKERFMIGKIDHLNFSQAQTNKDQSRIGYLNTLKSYWQKYYEVRKLTLYDFIKNQPLDFSIEEVID